MDRPDEKGVNMEHGTWSVLQSGPGPREKEDFLELEKDVLEKVFLPKRSDPSRGHWSTCRSTQFALKQSATYLP